MQSYWVHRYGFSTMPTINQLMEISGLTVQNDSYSFSEKYSNNKYTSYSEDGFTYPEDCKVNKNVNKAEELLEAESLPINHLNKSFQGKNIEDRVSKISEASKDKLSSHLNLRNCAKSSNRPPLPTLKNLRRWMPGIPEDFSKAS